MCPLVGVGVFGLSVDCLAGGMGSGGGIFQGFPFGFDFLVIFSRPWVLGGY